MVETIICSYDLCRFSTAEMKRLYRIFKSECPSGLITEEVFHNIFSKFFPLGAESYSGKQATVLMVKCNAGNLHQPKVDIKRNGDCCILKIKLVFFMVLRNLIVFINLLIKKQI